MEHDNQLSACQKFRAERETPMGKGGKRQTTHNKKNQTFFFLTLGGITPPPHSFFVTGIPREQSSSIANTFLIEFLICFVCRGWKQKQNLNTTSKLTFKKKKWWV